jgi:hypothetical protein
MRGIRPRARLARTAGLLVMRARPARSPRPSLARVRWVRSSAAGAQTPRQALARRGGGNTLSAHRPTTPAKKRVPGGPRRRRFVTARARESRPNTHSHSHPYRTQRTGLLSMRKDRPARIPQTALMQKQAIALQSLRTAQIDLFLTPEPYRWIRSSVRRRQQPRRLCGGAGAAKTEISSCAGEATATTCPSARRGRCQCCFRL